MMRVKVVVEVMGGVEPAYTFCEKESDGRKKCGDFQQGACGEEHGAELLEHCKEKNINFLSRRVSAEVPVLGSNSSLTADEIEEVTGILNGTTNYMLTKMFYEDADYDTVLKEAQANGYAEANPSRT